MVIIEKLTIGETEFYQLSILMFYLFKGSDYDA
jgi:hypothetical protein